MPAMRTNGPNCCCCNDLLWGNEHSEYTLATGPNVTGTIRYKPKKTGDPREFLSQINSPAADNGAVHMIAPDWQNKRLFYSYTLVTGGGAASDAYFRWWDATATVLPGATNNTQAVGVASGYLCDSLATNATTEKIYWAGRSHASTGGASPFANNATTRALLSINYDGTGQTLLDTVTTYRAGGIASPGGIGAMLVNRTADRLYYTVKQNVTTSTANDWVWEIRYRDLATFTETTIYSATATVFMGSNLGDAVIKFLDCLSFDVAGEKIYWCEHYTNTSGDRESKIRRANLEGGDLELLNQTADPFSANFARYSNKLKKIVHSQRDRTATPSAPKAGVYLRNPSDWSDATQIAQEGYDNITPSFVPTSPFLWCGYETTGAGAAA